MEGAHIQPGEAISLELGAATGGVPGAVITYQWQSCTADCHIESNWKDIPGGTGANLDFDTSTLGTTNIRRVASDGEQTNISNPVAITVYPPLTQPDPEDTFIRSGSNGSIELGEATGGLDGTAIEYQWQSCRTSCHLEANWTNVAGGTDPSLDIPAGTAVGTTNYRRQATDGNQTITSSPAAVTVTSPLTQPTLSGRTIAWGEAATIELGAATGGRQGATITYQWQSCAADCHIEANWKDIEGSTGLNYETAACDALYAYIRRKADNGEETHITNAADITVEFYAADSNARVTAFTNVSYDFQTQELHSIYISNTNMTCFLWMIKDRDGNYIPAPGVNNERTFRYLTIQRGKDGDATPETTGRIKIMLLNLGVEETDGVGLGDHYQWGRIVDGHQRTVWGKDQNSGSARGRNTFADGTSEVVARNIDNMILNPNGQIDPSDSEHYGKFITNNGDWGTGSGRSNLWGNTLTTRAGAPVSLDGWSIPANNPCPPGWRVPSIWDIWDIFRGNGTDDSRPNNAQNFNTATVNGWQWRALTAASSIGGASGGAIITNASGESVFLPITEDRSFSSGMHIGSSSGLLYWSTERRVLVTSSGLTVNSAGIGSSDHYANGMSIRCVQ